MIKRILLLLFPILFMSLSSENFKQEQLKYPRVREAYKTKKETVKHLLNAKSIKIDQLQLYFRAFKSEDELEVWGKNRNDDKYQLIKKYKVCRKSGTLGPKREQGDLQVPEGFYHINRFNPYSTYHLSLGINYPNKSDRILGTKGNLGGDIFIHGKCVTIGCLPMTNDLIKEIYILSVEARDNGQKTIPVTLFPARLSDKNFDQLTRKHAGNSDKIQLWKALKKGYDSFNINKKLFSVGFLKDGSHTVN